jgi:hypothetical protein
MGKKAKVSYRWGANKLSFTGDGRYANDIEAAYKRFLEMEPKPGKKRKTAGKKAGAEPKKTVVPRGKKKKRKARESKISIDAEKLKKFYQRKKPPKDTWQELLCLAYHLHLSGVSEITRADIQKCYSLLGMPAPEKLKNRILALKQRPRYLETARRGYFKINWDGIQYIEGADFGQMKKSPSRRKRRGRTRLLASAG